MLQLGGRVRAVVPDPDRRPTAPPGPTIYTTTTGTGGTQTLAVTGTGRYVRMNGTARATQYGYSLWEFQVFGTFAARRRRPAATPPNAALGRPATASSTENAGTPAGAAVDGNAGTRWSSAFSDPQWIQVDLGATPTICQVVLSWEAAYATAFQIQVSADGSDLDDHLLHHHRHRRHPDPDGHRHRPVRPDERHRRGPPQYGYSLWEFQVVTGGGRRTTAAGGDEPPARHDAAVVHQAGAPPRRRRTTATAANCTPAKAFDLDPATRWATSSTTGWVDPGWISVDLGATAHDHQVVLQWDPAFATAYQIQVSADASELDDRSTPPRPARASRRR